MRQPHTKKEGLPLTIIIGSSKKQTRFLPLRYLGKLETFLEKYSEKESELELWEDLAKQRIEKYKKAGLALRGARYRAGISQKELAKRSGISQENISKMENGKRPIGPKVAKALAKVLHVNIELLLNDA